MDLPIVQRVPQKSRRPARRGLRSFICEEFDLVPTLDRFPGAIHFARAHGKREHAVVCHWLFAFRLGGTPYGLHHIALHSPCPFPFRYAALYVTSSHHAGGHFCLILLRKTISIVRNVCYRRYAPGNEASTVGADQSVRANLCCLSSKFERSFDRREAITEVFTYFSPFLKKKYSVETIQF